MYGWAKHKGKLERAIRAAGIGASEERVKEEYLKRDGELAE